MTRMTTWCNAPPQLRDAADNLVGGQTNRFQYDGLDRLMEVAQAVDASHALTNRLIYNANNQCVQVLGGDAVSGADRIRPWRMTMTNAVALSHHPRARSSLAATKEYD